MIGLPIRLPEQDQTSAPGYQELDSPDGGEFQSNSKTLLKKEQN